MTETVFINYRRDDAGAEAKLLADALRSAIGSSAVFMDSSSVEFGATWPERIRSALSESRYVLVVIGPDWLRAGMNEWGQRRIDAEADWVRQEIATALADTNKTVIPVLVRGARIPPESALPTVIAGIRAKQAIDLRRDYWDYDVQLLTTQIRCEDGTSVHESKKGDRTGNPLFDSIWDRLAPDLQDAFVLAANAARREGKEIISTRTLFASLRRLGPDPLPEFFEKIPSEAPPEPIAAGVPAQIDALADIRLFSSCVRDSLDHLAPQKSREHRLTAEDVFVDIARHGRGASVMRLRTHGVDMKRIDEIVRQLGWSVADRTANFV